MITSSEITRVLENFEQKFPVMSWRYKRVSLWPLVRILVFSAVKGESSVVKKDSRLWVKVFNRLISYLLYLRLRLTFKKYTLFISHEEHWFNQGKKSFNKFFEQPILQLKDRKKFYLIAELRKNAISTVRSPNILNKLVVSYLFKKSEGGINELELELPKFDDFLNEISKSLGLDKRSINLRSNIASIFSQSLNWKTFLTKNPPDAVYMVCHYFSHNLAINIACSELEIPVVEIQHGNVNNYPPYMISFQNQNKFEMLPSHFWCWDTYSFESLKGGYFEKRATQLGHPWIALVNDENWKEENIRADYKPDINKNPVILFTLVYGQPLLPEIIKQIYKATKDMYQWWVRVHPRQVENLDKIVNTFQQSSIEAEFKVSSLNPLPLVLSFTSIHITSVSSIVLEAMVYNIPNFVISEEGWDRYGNIKEKVFYTKTSEEFLQQLALLNDESEREKFADSSNNYFMDFHRQLTQEN